MERRLAEGRCPVCGAVMRKAKKSRIVLPGKKQSDEPTCPNGNDGKHGQQRLTFKRAKKMGLIVKAKK
jgi:hypothetical protein